MPKPGRSGRCSRPSRRNVDRSQSCQKNGSRSSSKHSTNVWSGTIASRCDGDLRLLVVAQLHAERGAQPGRLAPDGRAARPGRIEVADVDGAVHDQVAQAVERHLALAGATGMPVW